MAKHISADQYTFTPSTKTVVLTNRFVRQEQIMLITNVTRNTVLYNFSDPSLGFSSFTNATSTSNVPTTTMVLNYNTASHLSTDKIAVLIEETNETFQPMEQLMDPVNKLRISQPQALIDTDFEYGTQQTKWESVPLINNRPFAFYNPTSTQAVTDITATNASRTVTLTYASGAPAAGTIVFVQDTTWGGADGLFIIDTTNGSTTSSYTARIAFTGTTGSIFSSGNSIIYTGSIFTGASIGAAGTATFTPGTGNAIAVVTTIPHGLTVGNEIAVTGITGTNPPNGSWIVSTVISPTAFTFYTTATASGLTVSSGLLYVRPQGTFLHRAFDGGVVFSTNAASHNQQLIRQTRRYFRYQSGKGIQMSTGTILKPSQNVDSITSSGTTVTVVNKQQNNINPGATITVSGCNETAYNGTFVVTADLDPYRFTYTALSTPSATTASGQYTLNVTSWYGASVRVGMFDNQNGIFFEFDGQILSAVRRSSTYQISGFASVNAGATTVSGITTNGVSTVFSKQLVPGDYIVIKGMSYRVDTISSDTSMTILPAYRGSSNLVGGIISKTIDLKIPQSTWNLDKADGTGISGFNLDLSKMQMLYLDYSWYGAGFIRWGFRGLTGDVIYCHKLPNNNSNYEAYMRSGNLPARYETNTFPVRTQLVATAASSDTVITVASTSGFPSSGTLLLKNNSTLEYVSYTGTTATTFTGLTRGQAGSTGLTFTTTTTSVVITGASTSGVQVGQMVIGTGIPTGTYVVSFIANTSVTLSQLPTVAGSNSMVFPPLGATAATFTVANASSTAPAGTAPITVESHSPQFASTISHWGTSVIMDGRFDDDKSFVFTRGMQAAVAVPNSASVSYAVMSFRIAPSVSNGLGGTTLGVREIVNRMQMVLRQMDTFSNNYFLITLVLNGTLSGSSPGTWANVGGSSLAQVALHPTSITIAGGETIYGFFTTPPGTVTSQYAVTQQDLNLVRDLGTSILGGGVATITSGSTAGFYPDGPDVITVMAQNLGAASANIQARLSWTEAQA